MVTNKYKVIAHIFIAYRGEHLTVDEVDCLIETVLVPDVLVFLIPTHSNSNLFHLLFLFCFIVFYCNSLFVINTEEEGGTCRIMWFLCMSV